PYTYRLVPELAESWEVMDNGATYRFHLRDGVAFQTTEWFKPKRNFNADDVVFTFQRIFDSDNPWHNVCLLYTSPSPRDRQKRGLTGYGC
ncbi:hypothetical protein DXF93_30035, partial [Escherichia coli]